MEKVRWTSEAESWLTDIFNYIAQDNPEAAQNVIIGIYEKAQILKSYPEIGHRYRFEEDGDVRILLYGHYRIAYRIKKDCMIDILGVFHGALDIDRYLG